MQNSSSFFQGQARFRNGFYALYSSPFGVELKGRNLKKNNAKNYRFGFQGQEGDDQIKGDGNSVNYKYRMHDPRLGRFFAVDPLSGKYPYYSSYQFSGNRVIDAIELEGAELKCIKVVLATHADGTIYVKSAVVLKIVEDYKIVKEINGKEVQFSETQIIYSYDGETKTGLTSIYEPCDYGDVDERFRGLYSSAKYNYKDSDSKEQKAVDDFNWIKSFGADPMQAMAIIAERDNNAPDAVYENEGLNDVLAGTQFLYIGKIKLRRDDFHKNTKKEILKATDKEYTKKVGDNPDITVNKSGNIELKATSPKHKGKTYDTGLNATDYLKSVD
jgi:RHS repeat-associated protein